MPIALTRKVSAGSLPRLTDVGQRGEVVDDVRKRRFEVGGDHGGVGDVDLGTRGDGRVPDVGEVA